jgi:hypothetical protein
VKQWRKQSPGTRVFNHYGPTETTVGCVVNEIDECGEGLVPIGRPIANTQAYILNDALQPVPTGVNGELHIGGAGVARGYLNRPDLTAERFLRNPFSADPQARMYKTGDVARWLPDGTIEYLGRNDDQVKVRGYRIELGEIEAQLVRHAQVKEAVVVAREQAGSEKQLVAYVTAANTEPAIDELRDFLKSALPVYMIPSAFVVLERIPLTPNGKADRSALPAPDIDAYATRQYEAPHGHMEEVLAGLWKELLHAERVGRHDDFFDLGGHSLLAMQVVVRLRVSLSVAIPMRSLFENPTVAQFAVHLETLRQARLHDTIEMGGDEAEALLEAVSSMSESRVRELMRTLRMEGRS